MAKFLWLLLFVACFYTVRMATRSVEHVQNKYESSLEVGLFREPAINSVKAYRDAVNAGSQSSEQVEHIAAATFAAIRHYGQSLMTLHLRRL